MKKVKFLIVAFLVGMLVKSADTAFNTISSISLLKGDEYSTVVIDFTHPATYSVEPNVEKKMIKVIFPQSNIGRNIVTETLNDRRVRIINLRSMSGSSAAVEVYLKSIKTSVYHSLSRDGKRLTLRLKSRNKLMALKLDPESPEQKLARKKEEDKALKKMAKTQKSAGREFYVKAMHDFHKNKFDDAVKLFGKFLKSYPSSIYHEKAMYTRAEALYRIAKKDNTTYNEAISAFRIAGFTYPLSPYRNRGRLRIADMFLDQNHFVEAAAIYHSVIKGDKDGKFVLSALSGKADIYLKKKEYNKAYNELEKILVLYPAAKEVREARFKIAEAFYFKKRYEKALTIFQDSNRKWPSYIKSNPDTMDYFADTYFQLKMYGKAQKLYIELMNLFPGADQGKSALNRVARILLIDNKPKAAIKLLGIQARQSPDDPEGVESRLRLAALGHARTKFINREEAGVIDYPDYFSPLETYNEIARTHAGSKEAHAAIFQKAKYLFTQKRFVKSIVTLKEMMVKFPDSRFSENTAKLVRDNFFQLIRNYHGQHGYYRVLATYYENFDPFLSDVRNPEIMIKVGDAYFETGLFKRAVEKYQTAFRLDRQGVFKERIAFSIGRSFASMRRWEDAENELKKFVGRFKNSSHAADAVHLLGNVYYSQKQFEKAVGSMRYAISLDDKHKENSRSAYYLGVMQKEMKEYSEATIYFQKAIDYYRPTVGKGEPRHFVESHYQLIETAYLAGDYESAKLFADGAVNLYGKNLQNSWARYIKSDSEAKLSEDEKAIISLKGIVETDSASIYGKVADASIGNINWKIKNKELFAY